MEHQIVFVQIPIDQPGAQVRRRLQAMGPAEGQHFADRGLRSGS